MELERRRRKLVRRGRRKVLLRGRGKLLGLRGRRVLRLLIVIRVRGYCTLGLLNGCPTVYSDARWNDETNTRRMEV